MDYFQLKKSFIAWLGLLGDISTGNHVFFLNQRYHQIDWVRFSHFPDHPVLGVWDLEVEVKINLDNDHYYILLS